MSNPGLTCRVCCAGPGSPRDHLIFTVREMMFGTREKYEYFECCRCGTVQIVQEPANPEMYYPSGYYSLTDQIFSQPNRFCKDILLRFLSKRQQRNPRLFRRLGWRGFSDQTLSVIRRCGVTPAARILDVGCGGGRLVYVLRLLGFKDSFGVDPFIQEDIRDRDRNIAVRKCRIGELEDRFDLIMFNHSLEHMSDPRQAMAKSRELLKPDGLILIRIPIADSRAYRWYGSNWIQLDAPRHLFVPTRRSVAILAELAGCRVDEEMHDSYSLQFEGSEMYLRDIPMFGKNSAGKLTRRKVFTRKQRSAFEEFAEILNARLEGDQAIFTLKRKPER